MFKCFYDWDHAEIKISWLNWFHYCCVFYSFDVIFCLLQIIHLQLLDSYQWFHNYYLIYLLITFHRFPDLFYFFYHKFDSYFLLKLLKKWPDFNENLTKDGRLIEFFEL